MPRRLKVQFRAQMFDGSDSASTLSFQLAFQMPCNTNGINGSTATWLLHFFLRKPACPTLRSCICLFSSSPVRQEGNLTPYFQILNYLFATHATDDIIAEVSMDVMSLKQPASQSAVGFVQLVWTKSLRCTPIHNEYRLEGTFIKELKQLIRHRVRGCWSKRESASLQELVHHSLSLASPWSGSGTP